MSLPSQSLCLLVMLCAPVGLGAQEILIEPQGTGLQRFEATPDRDGRASFVLPANAEAFVMPFSAGIHIEAADDAGMAWLRKGSPWELLELPLFGARYGDQTLAVILPWPHYARLTIDDRVRVTFTMPQGRHDAAPCEVVAGWTADDDILAIARVFRRWRHAGQGLGVIPRPVRLTDKVSQRPGVARLLGAAHFYLWGNARFSHHDVANNRWGAFAKALGSAETGPIADLVGALDAEAREALRQLAAAEWPELWLKRQVASAIDSAFQRSPELAGPLAEADLPGLRPKASWGDGASLPMLEALTSAGIDRAVLLTCDLYRDAVRADVVTRANTLGFVFGPYDSYHSVHSPDAAPDSTWETAQFDAEAYLRGRVINADGSGHAGFKGRGFHFAPASAWPYMQERVGSMRAEAPFSTWFIDCDATGQCFDDYSVDHPATRMDDMQQRRERLRWLTKTHQLVVGSEGGSVLFADVIDYGHGVDTPYIGHLDPALRDRSSAHFLGRHWPSDEPEMQFRAVPLPPSLRTPYFDPRYRIPLYRAAIGDELVTSHHWSFDSLKLRDVAGHRALLELLAMTPPMYHLSRSAWPKRAKAIERHYRFWSPLHRRLATAPLIRFDWLTDDRLLQRATYRTADGDIAITVNFAGEPRQDLAPRSVVVQGEIGEAARSYALQ